jgi:RiboL-PSP-HEPN
VLHKERDRVLNVIKLGVGIPIDNTDLLGHWGRYSCIVCAGYLEVALRQVIRDYVSGKATKEIQSYVLRDIESIQNPKAERFVSVMRSFNDDWALEMEKFFLNNQASKEAIDSLMANRHLIAHGRPCAISFGRVKDYFSSADKAIQRMSEILPPGGTID